MGRIADVEKPLHVFPASPLAVAASKYGHSERKRRIFPSYIGIHPNFCHSEGHKLSRRIFPSFFGNVRNRAGWGSDENCRSPKKVPMRFFASSPVGRALCCCASLRMTPTSVGRCPAALYLQNTVILSGSEESFQWFSYILQDVTAG